MSLLCRGLLKTLFKPFVSKTISKLQSILPAREWPTVTSTNRILKLYESSQIAYWEDYFNRSLKSRLVGDAFGFGVTVAGMGELINEFLPVKEKVHIVADMKEMGKDIWQTAKESHWHRTHFARQHGDENQVTECIPELR